MEAERKEKGRRKGRKNVENKEYLSLELYMLTIILIFSVNVV